MEIAKAVFRLKEAAHKDTEEARRLISWIAADIQALEVGLERGESIGEYTHELRYMRTYIEMLTRLSIQSYGCEEAIKALSEISVNDKEENK